MHEENDYKVAIKFSDLFLSQSYGFDRLLIDYLMDNCSFPIQWALVNKASLSFLRKRYSIKLGRNRKIKSKLSHYLNPPSLFDWAYAFKGSWPEHINKKLLIQAIQQNYPHVVKAMVERLPIDILRELDCDKKAASLGHKEVLDICLDTDWRTGKRRCDQQYPMRLFIIAVENNRFDIVQYLRKKNLVWNEGCYLAALRITDCQLAFDFIKKLATNKPPCPLSPYVLNRALSSEKYKIAAYILNMKKAQDWKYTVSSGVQRIIDEFIRGFKEEEALANSEMK